MKIKTVLTALLSLIIAQTGYCAPKPAIVPGANQWTLNVVFNQPQQITVKIPGERKPQRFWYIILTITNNSNMDAPFYPSCELVTDTFQVIPAYRDTRNVVLDQIKNRHKKTFPFLSSLETADTRILQGEDNTEDLVIIWPDFEANVKNISLFISGLSNETAVIEHPTKTDPNGNPEKIYLRKTLELQYSISGDPNFRSNTKLVYKGMDWVMR